MNTSKLIKKLRIDAGLTQQEVADKLSLVRTTYAAIEDGREPKLGEIRKLAELYQISPDDIVNGRMPRVQEPVTRYENQPEPDLPRDINPKVNQRKLRDVLLYLTEKIGAKPNVGETVIYKLLYFIDFDFYEKTGQSITGLTYVKNNFGPTPVSAFRDIVDKMEKDGEIAIVKTKYFSHDQKKYLPIKRADLGSLGAKELEHINWEIERLSDKTAAELTKFSHYDTPWVVAEMGKPLGYQFVFYRGVNTAVTEPEDEL
jgi:transcriptional regulator with XRE-family HTH domain